MLLNSLNEYAGESVRPNITKNFKNSTPAKNKNFLKSNLFTTHLEVVLRELVSYLQQVPASVRVGESANSEAVARIELPLQELAADILDFGKLKEASGRQQRLHVALFHNDLRRVAEVHQGFHGAVVNVLQRHLRLPGLCEFAWEGRENRS